MDFILHCGWLAIKTGLGTLFIIIGIGLFGLGSYWFFRGKAYLEEQIDPMNDVNFTDDDK